MATFSHRKEQYLLLWQQRSHVPKFGNWESGENVPYTTYFEKARQGRGGKKMINPNDPEENMDAFSEDASVDQEHSRTKLVKGEPKGQEAGGSAHEQKLSSEDGEMKQLSDSRQDGRRVVESPHHRYGGRGANMGDPSRGPQRQSIGSDHSLDKAPLHPHYQARLGAREASSPGWEGKGSTEGSHGTPGRSRMKPVNQREDSPDGGATVPRFGDWDETNPASAASYTHIFNKVREERHGGTARSPNISTDPPFTRRKDTSEKSKGRCFPCLGI
ncbi:RIN4, pathogenic type III effector avirulence factor Avr cleavage site [Dillenia turbinata]|uniref:RIN4, pathogenic type III effector avirulence factor Avr cleavage site n=1 Tax=Dillenia turbinata TaxID=194707 RepID=A0AAN8W337_9MAGN